MHNYYNTKLPLCYNPSDYGNVLLHSDNKYVVTNSKNITIIIEQCTDELDRRFNYVKYIKIIIYFMSGMIIILMNIYLKDT